MKKTTQFLTVLLIILAAIPTANSEYGTYDEPTIFYPTVDCGTGTLYTDVPVYFCWNDYPTLNMDHSFLTFEAMDAYYS